MATSINQQQGQIKNFSKGTQRTSSKFLRDEAEQELGINASYFRTGGVEKIAGYTQLGNTITTSSTSTSTSTTTTSTSTSTSTSSSTTTSSTSTSSTTTP